MLLRARRTWQPPMDGCTCATLAIVEARVTCSALARDCAYYAMLLLLSDHM